MKVIIFANGEFNHDKCCKTLLESCDLVIAADGGAAHALELGAKVSHLIGDMDSIGLEDFNILKKSDCKMHLFPQDKEKTDLELALDLAITKEATEIHILGGEGGRFDHHIGNALIAANPKYKHIPVWFYSKSQRATALYPAEGKCIKVGPDSIVSVIPLSPLIEEFSISGVQWPLDTVELTLGSTFTISNRSTAPEIIISFKSGVVLLVIDDF